MQGPTEFPLFLSVVVVSRNQADLLRSVLPDLGAELRSWVSDHEIVVVDNASEDDSLALLKSMTSESGLPNLQIFGLAKEVDRDTAACAGLEGSLGDFVAVIDLQSEDPAFLTSMLRRATEGVDVVFASNSCKPRETLAYRVAGAFFDFTYRWLNGVSPARDAPGYRLMSRRVVNFLLQHPKPALSYRVLPATAGFVKAMLEYRSPPRGVRRTHLGGSIDRGLRMLVSSTRAPMRLVTALSLFGAAANVVYSIYVIAVALLKEDVAAGWVTLSLQASGMFLLISLVLLVLSEYVMHLARAGDDAPEYHVATEFTSARMTRLERLNVESRLGRIESRAPDPA